MPNKASSRTDKHFASERPWRKSLDAAAETPASAQIPAWLTRLNRFSAGGAIAISVATVVAIGVVDYATGPRVALSALYLFPACCLTWRMGFPAGRLLCLFSASVALVADAAHAGGSWGMAFPYWNFVARFLMFLFVMYLLSMLQRLFQTERESHRRDEEARTRLRRWSPDA